MMESGALIWLMAASAVIWLGIGGYLAFLAARQGEIKKRLQQLELLFHDK